MLQKRSFFYTRLRENLHICNGTRKKIFDGLVAIFCEKTLITLSKMTQNLKIRACFMQNFMELHMKKVLDPKAVAVGAWDLKTSLGQVGPRDV